MTRTPLLPVVAAALACASAAADEPQFPLRDRGAVVPLEFSVPQTVPGQSVFVRGPRPVLGNWEMPQAPKLEPSAFPLWRLRVWLPEDTGILARLAIRDDAAGMLGSSANGTDLGEPFPMTVPPAPGTLTRTVTVGAGSLVGTARLVPHGGDTSSPFLPTILPDGRRRFTMPWREGDTIVFDVESAPARRTDAQHLYVSAALDNASWVDADFAAMSPPRRADITAFASPQLGGSRTIRVYLPRGYDSQPERRFPVLYMYDGQNLFDPGGAFGSWSLNESLPLMFAGGSVPEIIVVGIDSPTDGVSRVVECTPPEELVFGILAGRADDFRDFLVQTLAPHIDANFRTIADRHHRIVGGSSMGGVVSSYIALERPEFASRYLVFSPAYWLAGGQIARFRDDAPRDVAIYMDSGDQSSDIGPPLGTLPNDGLATTMQMRDAMLRPERYVLGLNMFFAIGYGDAHNEAAWKRRFPEALRTMFRGPLVPGEPSAPKPNGIEVR